MSIQVPDNPNIDDLFTMGGVVRRWNGKVWLIQGPNFTPSLIQVVSDGTLSQIAIPWNKSRQPISVVFMKANGDEYEKMDVYWTIDGNPGTEIIAHVNNEVGNILIQ
jgi:hypothetical protein